MLLSLNYSNQILLNICPPSLWETALSLARKHFNEVTFNQWTQQILVNATHRSLASNTKSCRIIAPNLSYFISHNSRKLSLWSRKNYTLHILCSLLQSPEVFPLFTKCVAFLFICLERFLCNRNENLHFIRYWSGLRLWIKNQFSVFVFIPLDFVFVSFLTGRFLLLLCGANSVEQECSNSMLCIAVKCRHFCKILN